MVSPIFQVHGAHDVNGTQVVLTKSPAAPSVSTNFAASWLGGDLALVGNGEWYVQGSTFTATAEGTQQINPDTVPPDQGGVNDFSLPGGTGACLIMPLADGQFVVAAGAHVYIQAPTDTGFASRLFVSDLSTGGTHSVVAISKVGSTARVMYATRGNAARSARVLTLDLTVEPSGTVASTSLPTYGSTIPGPAPWEENEYPDTNWYTGLIPHVMGAFEYCVFRNADRSLDGTNPLPIGVAIGAPYASGGEFQMSGYQVNDQPFPDKNAYFRGVTFGGTMSGSNLTAQSILTTDAADKDAIIAASGITDDAYYFDRKLCALALSFEPPPGPTAFWTNLRLATETI